MHCLFMEPGTWTLDSHYEFDLARFLESLPPTAHALTSLALRDVLCVQGNELAGTKWVKALGAGLFEFRIRGKSTLVRIFFTFKAGQIVMLLGAYDKQRDPSAKRQNREILIARARMQD